MSRRARVLGGCGLLFLIFAVWIRTLPEDPDIRFIHHPTLWAGSATVPPVSILEEGIYCLLGQDLDGDGIPSLIAGYQPPSRTDWLASLLKRELVLVPPTDRMTRFDPAGPGSVESRTTPPAFRFSFPQRHPVDLHAARMVPDTEIPTLVMASFPIMARDASTGVARPIEEEFQLGGDPCRLVLVPDQERYGGSISIRRSGQLVQDKVEIPSWGADIIWDRSLLEMGCWLRIPGELIENEEVVLESWATGEKLEVFVPALPGYGVSPPWVRVDKQGVVWLGQIRDADLRHKFVELALAERVGGEWVESTQGARVFQRQGEGAEDSRLSIATTTRLDGELVYLCAWRSTWDTLHLEMSFADRGLVRESKVEGLFLPDSSMFLGWDQIWEYPLPDINQDEIPDLLLVVHPYSPDALAWAFLSGATGEVLPRPDGASRGSGNRQGPPE